MSRPRHIDPDAILDAAEAVILRDGLAKLTLDAVSHEANVSKASVIYDLKSKQGLVRAIVSRLLARDQEALEAAILTCSDSPNPPLAGMIALMREEVSERDKAIAVGLCAAFVQDEEITKLVKTHYKSLSDRIQEASDNKRSATLAHLALEGLRSLEWYNLSDLTPEVRKQILDEIAHLSGTADKSSDN